MNIVPIPLDNLGEEAINVAQMIMEIPPTEITREQLELLLSIQQLIRVLKDILINQKNQN